MDDVDNVLVPSPAMRARLETGVREDDALYHQGTINYLEREARNRSLGLHGEEFVLRYEHSRLIMLGKPGLAHVD